MKHAPKAEEIVHIRNIHGKTLKDPWFWVREKESERVQALLRSENSYVDSEMADTLELQESLYNEMIGRIKETDTSVPVKRDDYFYYSRTVKGLQYSIYCRKLFSMEAPEEILLDCNTLAEGRPYFNLGSIAVSPDHKRMAYAIDVTGAESYTIFIKDVTTGMLLPDQIDNSGGSICWAKDSNTFFYNILDKAKRPFKIFRHSVGTPPEKDALIFHEKDESFFVSVHKSKDRQYIFITLKSNTTSEAYFLEASRPQDKLKLVQKRCPKMEYFAEHQEGRFIILTNWKAQNFRLMSAPVETSSREHWHEIIAHRPEVKLDDFDVYRGRLVIYERENGLTRIRIQEEDTEPYFIAFPETVYTAWDDTNPDYEAESVRYGYTSMVTPRSIFEYDFKTRKSTLLKETEVQGGYDKAQYVTERLYVKSHDGTEIPMSAVYRRDLDRSRSARLFLYGYGSYGITVHPEFSSIRLSLLDRGYVFVIAHIRGGGYLGRPWYESGKLLNKKNTFEDFIACSRYLIDRGWTEPEKMVICGGSAGGLLIGAALNAAPELFGAAIAQVPFVDVINTMLDPSLPLTVMEYEEWGNPNEKEYFDYIHSYSPYDNVLKRAYPEILVMTGVNDPRVQYWEPLKWVQKLRAHNTGNKKVLLKINMGAGHGGASGRYDYLREIAFEYAFVISRIGGETDGALHREKEGGA